jgi:aminoglycoside phosphotransferase (APT) family kinase protein
MTVFQTSDIEHLSDDELVALFEKTSQPMDCQNSPYVSRISERTVLKFIGYDNREALALQLVSEHTDIPVPRIWRTVRQDDGRWWVAMEYIPGTSLSYQWPSMGCSSRVKAAFTIRSYVRRLRRLRSPLFSRPGQLSELSFQEEEEDGGGSRSPLWGSLDYRGPFESSAHLGAFLNDRNNIGLWIHGEDAARFGLPRDARFADSEPVVFTHQDLHLRNFILGEDGQIWMIDFDRAGLWPEWFEFVAMRLQIFRTGRLDLRIRRSWNLA